MAKLTNKNRVDVSSKVFKGSSAVVKSIVMIHDKWDRGGVSSAEVAKVFNLFHSQQRTKALGLGGSADMEYCMN